MQNDIDADIMTRDGFYENEDQRSAEALTKSIEAKQREIERYIDIYNNDGAVYSDWTGVVTGVTVRAGDVTSDGAAVLINSEPDIVRLRVLLQQRMCSQGDFPAKALLFWYLIYPMG